jgi:protein O-mannosyl-transferase
MKSKANPPKSRNYNWVAAIIFVVCAFLLYGNTLNHKYCLDDAIVITRNEFTKKGFDGIGDIFTTESFTGFFGKQKELVSGARYRPLSVATFAIEKQFDRGRGRAPFVSHLINVLLYALTGFFIFLLLKNVLKNQKAIYKTIPFLAALLFLFHPVHTEVVANIKSRDEILALLFSLAGCYAIIKFKEENKRILLYSGTLLWFLALLSKENAMVFWVLMPMLLYLSGIREVKKYVFPLIAFTIAAITFLIIRNSVVGSGLHASDELMNNSFLHATIEQKYATIFYTLWKYIVLLFYPVTLTFDYYPYHISLVDWGNAGALAGFIIYLVLLVLILVFVKKNFFIALALLIYLLPLLPVSNLLFPIGTFMSERFIYFSSLGFCMLLALGISVIAIRSKTWKYGIYLVTGVILILFGIKTISRNRAWDNDYTLFTTDVKTSYHSAKSNCSAGGVILESSDTINDTNRKQMVIDQSINYLKRAVSIHPKYYDAWLLLGNAYFKKENCTDSAFWCYSTILSYNSDHENAFNNSIALVNREKNEDIKLAMLEKLNSYKPDDYQVNYMLGSIYGKVKNDLDKAIKYLRKAASLNPGVKDAYIDLGVAYGLKRDYAASIEVLQKALAIDPSDAGININLGFTYQNLGNIVKANEYYEKARKLKK